MLNHRLVGTMFLSLVIAAPVMAKHPRPYYRDGRHLTVYRDGRHLTVQDALHFGYGSGRCGSHSGYGGLYGDGQYPGNVCEDVDSHLIDHF